MAYVIEPGESVEAALKRIATEQIDDALAELTDPQLDRHEAVHQGRKRCKKIRALLRLVRPGFEPSFADENAWFRDAARELAWVRDAQSALETHLALVDRFSRQLEPAAVGEVTAWLTARRDRVAADDQGLQQGVERFQQRLLTGRDRVAHWSLRCQGFEAVAGGLVKTYQRGVRAMKAAYDSPSTETFHEWRKRVKYHWYHSRLLRKLHPGMLKAQRDAADRLGELLGQEHDLAVLGGVLAECGEILPERTVQTLLGLMDRRRKALRRQARRRGGLLYCETPKRLRRRLGCYWEMRMR